MIDWKKFEDLLIEQGFSEEKMDAQPESKRFFKEIKINEGLKIKLDIVTNPDEDNASFEILIDSDGIVRTIYSGFNNDVFKGYFLMAARLNKCFADFKKI